MRERKSSQRELARPKTRNAIAEASRPISSAGRRPYLSDTRPQIGEAISWAIENEAIIQPTISGVALSLSA
jgi:hypothetical protein